MPATKTVLPELRGDRLRASYWAGVSSLMGTKAPPVVSRGGDFFHKARWTRRILVDVMCRWAKANPGCCPTRDDVAKWVREVNYSAHVEPMIQIAATPERVTTRLAMALVGGAYHEALHGLMSCKRDLTVNEVCDLVIPRWAKVPDWSKLTRLLLDWSNIVEDVRIERRGIEEFPGIKVKMHDLQDFILNKEAQGRAEATAAGHHEATKRTITIVSSVFRDVGLGYNTDAQRLAMQTYRTLNPEAVKLVLDGPLSPYLRETIDLPVNDGMGALRVAMDVLAELSQMGEAEGDEPQEGQGGKPACPDCGAPGSKLKVRPMSDGNGGKVKGKGVLTCTACGHQEIVDLEEGGEGPSGPQDPEDAIQYEDIPQDAPEDTQEGQDGGDQGEDDSEPQEGQGGSQGDESDDSDDDSEGKGSSDSDEDDSDEDDSDEEGQGGSGDDSDDDSDDIEEGHAPGEGDDSDEEGEEGEEGDGEGDDTDDTDDGDMEEPGDNEGDKPSDTRRDNLDQTASDDAKQEEQGQTADDSSPNNNPQGGGHDDSGDNWKAMAESILDDADEGAGLLDSNTALADSFNEEIEREDDACERDESPWRPLDASLDDVHFVRPADKASAKAKADKLLKSVKRESSFLRARLRNIVLALEQTDTEHGLRRGRGLSQRMLVDSKCALMGGQAPDRAYYDVTEQIDTSLAAAVVIDESGSMSSILQDATRVMMAITEPLDGLGCAVQVSGFRNGRYGSGGYYGYPEDAGTVQYHRHAGVRHDVFKAFDEKFSAVKHRFSCTQATGGTPMADGVKFGLDGLNDRPEAHRVLFVVTDGCPDGGHMPVIKRLIRIANEAGIHVVGVGLGYGAEYVKNVFPDYVWTNDVSDMPKALVRKLNQLLDFTGASRGRRMRKVS